MSAGTLSPTVVTKKKKDKKQGPPVSLSVIHFHTSSVISDVDNQTCQTSVHQCILRVILFQIIFYV